MKKILGLLVILVTLTMSSCTEPSWENSTEKLTVMESNEILSMPLDTVIISKDEYNLYIIEDNYVREWAIVTNNNGIRSLPVGALMFMFLACVISGFFIGLAID